MPVLYSPESRVNSTTQPGHRLLCSEDVRWTSALLEVWRQPASVEEFTTVPTPDQVVVLTSAGQYSIESYAHGAWRAASYGPGKGGATAPLNVSRLRWRSKECRSITTLHLYLPPVFLEEAGEEYRRAGRPASTTTIDYLSMDDSLVYETVRALTSGVQTEAPNLYCDSACRMLATHLLLLNGKVSRDNLERRAGYELTDRRLARVLEYMREHTGHSLSLDQLSREAGISRFHFVRLFRARVGMAPHQFLVDLRLRKAAALLLTSDLDVAAIAAACGYVHPGRFALAFRKQYFVSPSVYRRSRLAKSPRAI